MFIHAVTVVKFYFYGRVIFHCTYVSQFLKLLLFFIVVQLQFYAFPPTSPALPSSLPCFHTPLVIVHLSFIVVLANPSPFSPIIPSPLPSGHCQPVLNFSVFGSICLLVRFIGLSPLLWISTAKHISGVLRPPPGPCCVYILSLELQ